MLFVKLENKQKEAVDSRNKGDLRMMDSTCAASHSA